MRKIFFIVIALSFSLFLQNYAQEQQQLPLLDVQNKKFPNSFERFYRTRSIIQTIAPQVLEAELEANNYIVGPGDQFKISVFGAAEKEFNLTLLPEGSVVVDGIGEYELKGLTLHEAKKIIKTEIQKYYINAEIRVNLTGLRKFRVYLTGEVNNPGTYFAQGSDRISDVLEVAAPTEPRNSEEPRSGLNDWADDTKIEIHRLDGTVLEIDITQFYRFGDKSHNPYLQGGDIIFAPSINLSESYVIIEGNVGYQGIYSLKDNENLFQFLRRVSALSKRSNLENIILVRDEQKTSIDLLHNQEDYMDFKLQDRDKIIIPVLFRTVYVRGEVFAPGELPYLANYRAKDYIGQAGALDSGVGEDDIIVIRQTNGEVLKGGDVIVEKGDTIILPKRSREVFKDYMTIFAPIISLLIATVALVQN